MTAFILTVLAVVIIAFALRAIHAKWNDSFTRNQEAKLEAWREKREDERIAREARRAGRQAAIEQEWHSQAAK